MKSEHKTVFLVFWGMGSGYVTMASLEFTMLDQAGLREICLPLYWD